MAAEKVRLQIGSVSRAILVTGQAYQDPKDALNEFVSNAADTYAELGERGGRIRVILRRRGRYPTIAVEDIGAGMTPDRLRQVAKSLFKSVKAGDDRTLGEKAIGLLAFQQLGGRMDIVSRAGGSSETWCLHLERGKGTAHLDRERRRARDQPGTTIYLRDLDQQVLRMLTQRKVVDYLRRRRAAALARSDYEIEVIEGRSSELVTPEEPEGVKVQLPAQRTLWGTVEFAIWVAPPDSRRRTVAVVGRGGTSIVDSVTELEEFDAEPWNTGQLSGRILFEALAQTAGRRAILRDDQAFPLFADAVRSVEPALRRVLERVNAEVDAETTERLSEEIRKIFSRVLRELEDLDNPMRTTFGDQPDDDGTLLVAPSINGSDGPEGDEDPLPPATELANPGPPRDPGEPPTGSAGDGARSRKLPSLVPDPAPGEARSRFDPAAGVVLYNDRHPDYLMVQADEPALLDYFATLVAKEYVVYNNPATAPESLGEELVRMLIRVRQHLRRRR